MDQVGIVSPLNTKYHIVVAIGIDIAGSDQIPGSGWLVVEEAVTAVGVTPAAAQTTEYQAGVTTVCIDEIGQRVTIDIAQRR